MNIGSIKQNDAGIFVGKIATLTIAMTIALREVHSANPKAPKYEVLALSASRAWVQVGALFGGPAAGRRVPLRRGTHDPTLRATTRSAPGRTVSVNGSAAIGSPSAIATGGSAPRAGACSIVTVRAR